MPLSFRVNLIFALFIHVLILSFVWVGFAVPLPRNEVRFYYSGPAPITGDLSTASDLKDNSRPGVMIKSPEAAFFLPWMQMRDLNKPRT